MKKLFCILFVLSGFAADAQKMVYKGFPSMVWPKLYSTTFVKASDGLGEFEKPVFPEQVKALANKTIVLPGFMVPLDNTTQSARIMLSSLPLNACFFCGVGGPETVIEVHLKEQTSYIQKPIEVKGTLRLNDDDPDKMIYVLEDAVILGAVEF